MAGSQVAAYFELMNIHDPASLIGPVLGATGLGLPFILLGGMALAGIVVGIPVAWLAAQFTRGGRLGRVD
jgi:hypothetical protein